MPRFIKYLFLTAVAISLTACGGGGTHTIGGDNNGGGGTNDNTIASLEIAASSRQLPSDGSDPVTISAIAKDSNNNIVTNVDVVFKVNGNATIDPDSGNAASAVKTAKLTPALDAPENRTVTVTVTAENKSKKLNVDIVGTTLQIDGPDRIVLNTASTFTLSLKDASGNGLAYYTVVPESANNNTIEADSGAFTTDANGELKFTLTANQSGTDTITAEVLGANYTKTVEISADEFTVSSNVAEVAVNTSQTISVLWKKDGQPQAGKSIALVATRGSLPAQAVTDAQGVATFSISSATAGGTVITATTGTGLAADLVLEFISTTPAMMSLQANPSIVAPDAQSAISAVVHDTNHNPVKHQVVTFNLTDTVGGALSNAKATTDSLGRAMVYYTAGDSSSAKDGVVIDSALQGYPAINDSVSLTVGNESLRLVLGSDEKITEDGIYYGKSYGVIVTDSAGNPVANQKVDFLVTPFRYWKGFMSCDPNGDNKWYLAQYTQCDAEDVNNNGWLDTGEDFNGNGKLEPTQAATITGSGVTDEDGKITAKIIYPQSEAWWSAVEITAVAKVAGTEYIEKTKEVLPVLATDIGSCDVSPPNAVSPYGTADSCANPD